MCMRKIIAKLLLLVSVAPFTYASPSYARSEPRIVSNIVYSYTHVNFYENTSSFSSVTRGPVTVPATYRTVPAYVDEVNTPYTAYRTVPDGPPRYYQVVVTPAHVTNVQYQATRTVLVSPARFTSYCVARNNKGACTRTQYEQVAAVYKTESYTTCCRQVTIPATYRSVTVQETKEEAYTAYKSTRVYVPATTVEVTPARTEVGPIVETVLVKTSYETRCPTDSPTAPDCADHVAVPTVSHGGLVYTWVSHTTIAQQVNKQVNILLAIKEPVTVCRNGVELDILPESKLSTDTLTPCPVPPATITVPPPTITIPPTTIIVPPPTITIPPTTIVSPTTVPRKVRPS
jgi:hypothetical protein